MSQAACAKKIICDFLGVAAAQAGIALAQQGLLTESEMKELTALDETFVSDSEMVFRRAMRRLESEERSPL